MQRGQVLLGVLGLVLASTAVRADVPKTVKILGQDYTVTAVKRYGLFKNGVTVNLQKGGGDTVDDATVAKKANLCFVPGATAADDRLFVVAAHQDDPGPTSDGLYILKGADANGVFSPENSEATVLIRGNKEVHGRMQNITFLNDTDTGTKKDRNLFVCTFTTTNMMRFLDLGDLLAGAPHTDDSAFRKATTFIIKEPGDTEATVEPDPLVDDLPDDENAPDDPYFPAAIAPNGMLIVAGTVGGEPTISVLDPVKGEKFFPVKTDLVTVTDGKVEATGDARPHTFARLTGDEYLMMVTDPDAGVNADETSLNSQYLYHLRITLPTDLTNPSGTENPIKAEFIDREDLPALALGQSPTHKMYGLAVGREVAAGKPTLYMADWDGNLFTLRPNVTAGQ
jgi:hypothetical protein